MTEVNLAVFPEIETNGSDTISTTPMEEVNKALKECGFGRFHVRLLFTAFLGITAGISVSNSTAFLLPSAECDLHMTLIQKGWLNAIPYLGMILSSVVAGFLTDTFGRKIFLVYGNLGLFMFALLSGSSQTYWVLISAKLFEGILFATSFTPIVALTSELCHSGIRDRIIVFQSSFSALAQILLALVAWAILTQDWRYSLLDDAFVLNTWNFYLCIMSIWSLSACILYSFLPESPKFLVTQGKFDSAREILMNIYEENTGKSSDTFLYKNLWKNLENKSGDSSKDNLHLSFRHQIVASLHNVKPVFKKPLVVYLITICLMSFSIMMLYNVLRLWFPQLSTIIEHNSYEQTDNDLCHMLNEYTKNARKQTNSSITAECVPTKSGNKTYLSSMILGCVSLIPYSVMGVLVSRVGKKRLLTIAGIITSAATLGLTRAGSTAAMVLMYLDISVTQTMLSLNQAWIVEYFGTATRSLALSLLMVSGRIGTLSGNISFPILLNMGCVVPFFTLSGVMIGCTLLSLMLPKSNHNN